MASNRLVVDPLNGGYCPSSNPSKVRAMSGFPKTNRRSNVEAERYRNHQDRRGEPGKAARIARTASSENNQVRGCTPHLVSLYSPNKWGEGSFVNPLWDS